uniref:Pepsin inhibitor-3-like repeated domain-containing protein n=1 Tax=Meloidogyne incognita TaxID=6306 RepID=A0A914NCG0_MELIC
MSFIIFLLIFVFSAFVNAQFYSPPMTGSGCVATGNKLYSHGNFIRELNGKEMSEMEIYKNKLLEWKQQVDEAYARLEQAVQRNNSAIPIIPPRPALPSFCTSNQTTLYILAGCTVQNNKVYIAGKFARELNEKEKGQLDEFAKQMLAQQQASKMENKNAAFGNNIQEAQSLPAADSAINTPPPPSSSSTSTPLPTTTISLQQNADIGRQIALDFCMEF